LKNILNSVLWLKPWSCKNSKKGNWHYKFQLHKTGSKTLKGWNPMSEAVLKEHTARQAGS
jgi:hypothetical protein